MSKLLLIEILLVSISLSACGISTAELQSTGTQVAAAIYATQTFSAPTSTPTYTPTPTATFTPTSTATPTSTPTLTPTPTHSLSYLFSDDFSNPNSGWQDFSDSNVEIGYFNGGYRFFVNGPNYYSWSRLSRVYSDVIINVDSVKVSGLDSNEHGVICRMQDMYNYYLFSIANDGHYAIWKQVDGEWSQLGESGARFNDDAINPGNTPNHIIVTCQGDRLSLQVNGHNLMDVQDADFSVGDIGLYTGAYDAAGVEVLFDNFIASRP